MNARFDFASMTGFYCFVKLCFAGVMVAVVDGQLLFDWHCQPTVHHHWRAYACVSHFSKL